MIEQLPESDIQFDTRIRRLADLRACTDEEFNADLEVALSILSLTD